MSIPLTSVTHAEVIMQGLMSSEGSNTINTQFVFQFRRTATAISPTKAALDTIFQSTIADKIVLALNLTWAQTLNSVRWMDDALDQAQPFTHANAGAITGDRMATHLAVFALFRTGIKGRSYRGGKHFGPLSETDTTAGGADILNAAAITRFGAIITGMMTPLVDSTTNTWKLSVFSRVGSIVKPNPTTIVTNDVTSVLLNKRLGNMRRRQVKSVY